MFLEFCDWVLAQHVMVVGQEVGNSEGAGAGEVRGSEVNEREDQTPARLEAEALAETGPAGSGAGAVTDTKRLYTDKPTLLCAEESVESNPIGLWAAGGGGDSDGRGVSEREAGHKFASLDDGAGGFINPMARGAAKAPAPKIASSPRGSSG